MGELFFSHARALLSSARRQWDLPVGGAMRPRWGGEEWGRHSTNGSPSPASPEMWPHCITLSTCPFRWSDIPGSENEMETSAVEDFSFRMPDGAQKFLCLNLSRQAAHRPSSHSSPAVITNAQQLAEKRWRISSLRFQMSPARAGSNGPDSTRSPSIC